MTTLIEARLLAGNAAACSTRCARRVSRRTASGRCKDYFEAKVAEQQDRHLKANDTAYNLEPNVKTSPGGLRDIQTIALGRQAPLRRRARSTSCVDARLPVAARAAQAQARRRRSCGRCASALHVLTGRREDRLLFDHQIQLAQMLRLRGRDLHARGRAVHAALLPHGHGREPAERTAAAAVPRGDPAPRPHRRVPLNRALPGPQRLPRSRRTTTCSRARRRRCSSCSWCCSRTRT